MFTKEFAVVVEGNSAGRWETNVAPHINPSSIIRLLTVRDVLQDNWLPKWNVYTQKNSAVQ